ncbi:hemolysin-III related-domain-containing protein [Aspergillus californicus]
MQRDPYITQGYRRQSNSYQKCFWSLFYLHNESVNTWSHILPGLYFLVLLFAIDHWALQIPFHAPLSDIFAIQAYVTGTAGCLIFSAAFHATDAHSPEVATAFLKLDYIGIILTISTTCISVTYFAMHENTLLQAVYISFTILCAVAVFWATLDARMDGPRAAPWRKVYTSFSLFLSLSPEFNLHPVTVFTLLATGGLAPLFHLVWLDGLHALYLRVPLDCLAVTCTSYAVGAMAYVTRFPEKYWVGRFDIFGASHQTFHVLVAFGQIVHLYGLKTALLNIHLGICQVGTNG